MESPTSPKSVMRETSNVAQNQDIDFESDDDDTAENFECDVEFDTATEIIMNLQRRQGNRNLEISTIEEENETVESVPLSLLGKQMTKMNMNHQPLDRQKAFKKSRDKMKGASTLNISDFHKYDTAIVVDSTATPSTKIAKANAKKGDIGDDDVWIEKIFHKKIDRTPVTVFVSTKTGKRVIDEPPTGASRAIYLK
mmetsp:Transcript_25973/g.32017  ORF Transcript_25973/g.32017 Transcript_25973/m.32017 type:complete len:196 (+) Transcript_25973:52-639(+)